MNKYFSIIFLLLFFMISQYAYSYDKNFPDKITGKYKLNIENDLHHNYGSYIEITKIDNNKIFGNIAIDWNLGAEDRKPMDWETLYILPFDSAIKNYAIKFTATVASQYKNVTTSYDFYLKFTFKNDNYELSGYSIIKTPNGKKTKNKVSTKKL